MLRLGVDPRDPTRSKPLDKSTTPEVGRAGGQYSRRRLQAEGAFVALGGAGIIVLIIALYLIYCFMEQQEFTRLSGKEKDLAVKV